MSKRVNIAGGSNWETIAFLLINQIVIREYHFFFRSQLMSSDNIDLATEFSALLGHKKNPAHPEETLQRTIQNLRDKGFINFLGQGEYKLTTDGYYKMLATVESVKTVLKNTIKE